MKKILKFGEEAISPISSGIQKMAKVVGSTMGPHGKTVLIQAGYGFPKATRDGVTVARELRFADQFEELGAAMLRQASAKTNDVAGDGTTQTVVLAAELYERAWELINKGAKTVTIKSSLDRVRDNILGKLATYKKEVTTLGKLIDIATISANDKKLGEDVATAVWKAGKDGSVTIEESQKAETTIDQTSGFRFDRPWVSPYFITDVTRGTAELEDAFVLVLGDKLESLYDIANILKAWNKNATGSLLIVANEFTDEVLALLVQSKLNGTKVCAVKTPDFGEHRDRALLDIAAVTGAKLIGAQFGVPARSISEAKGMEILGKVKKVICSKDSTVFVEPSGKQANVDERIADAKFLLDNEESEYQKGKHRQRLGRLTGGVVVIKVGGNTDTEARERKFRVEDAVAAAQSAFKDGYLIGGGKALINAVNELREANEVDSVLTFGFHAPTAKIIENSGENVKEVLAKLMNECPDDVGYNALTGEYVKLDDCGIVDPFKATEQAVINAVSVVSILLTTSAGIIIEPEKEDIPGQM